MENENKKSALQMLADKIVEWDAQLDGLKETASTATGDLKEEYKKLAEDLAVKKKEAEVKLEELKKSSGEGWEEIKVGAEKAMNELSDAFARAREKFKK